MGSWILPSEHKIVITVFVFCLIFFAALQASYNQNHKTVCSLRELWVRSRSVGSRDGGKVLSRKRWRTLRPVLRTVTPSFFALPAEENQQFWRLRPFPDSADAHTCPIARLCAAACGWSSARASALLGPP